MFCALNGATATPRRREPAADPGDERALAGVGRRAGDQQRTPHGASHRPAVRRRSPAYRGHVRFLLRPGWLALHHGGAASHGLLRRARAVAVRAGSRPRRPAAGARHRLGIPPAPLAQVLPPDGVTAGGRVAAGDRHRHVSRRRRGRGPAAGDDGKPAFEVLTPLRTDRRPVVAVDRGFATVQSGAAVPAYAAPPAGRGDARRPAARRRDRPAPPAGVHRRRPPTALRHRRPTLATATGLPISPGYPRWPRISPACSRRCRSRPPRRRAPRRSPTSPTPCNG